MSADERLEVLTLAGGCYWCMEAPLRLLAGVHGVVSGFMGGHVANPNYEEVCGGGTGHAEVVQLHYDPQVLNCHDLLEVFFTLHDPTTRNRQGNDVGTQYRSGIYTSSDAQKEVADSVIREIEASKTYSAPVVTEVAPLANYSTAEAYHQDYFLNHPNQGYCAFVVGPKVEKFQKTFASRVKA